MRGVKVQALLARAGLRRGRWTALGLVSVLTLGLGASLTAIEAADRTVSAYPDHLQRNDVADLVVNPVLANERTGELIESTPGVRRVVSDSLLTGALADDPSATSPTLQFRVSQDGRYVEQDRPAVRDGRMIRSGNEVFLSAAAAEDLDAEVGDVFDVGFFGVNEEDPTSITPGPMVREVPLTVVGIGTFADGVLPDELFPREYALITPEAAGDADCLQRVPDPDDRRDAMELLVASVPAGCAMTYRYYSLDLEGGPAAAAGVAAELGERFRAENRDLPESLRANDVGYFLIPSFTGDDARNVRQALSPTVTSLRVFGIATGLVVLGVALVLVGRQLRRDDELVIWRGLGLGSRGRATAIAAAPIAAAVVGALGGVAVAVLASPLGPLASARTVEPHPGRSLSGITLVTALVALTLLVLGIGVMAWRHADRAVGRTTRPSRARWTPSLGSSPMLSLGLRSAVRERDARAAALGSGIVVAAVTATLLYAVAIGQLVDDPDRYGWSFDGAVVANYGYGPVALDAVRADLDRPDVAHWATAVVSGNFTVDGESVPAIAGRSGFEHIAADFPVVEGRLPTGDGELAVGAATADDLDLAVGDRVTVGSPFGEHDATLTGLVVLPDIGPFQSGRTSLATGALLPGPLMLATYGELEEATGRDPAAFADGQAAVVFVDLADGADPDAVAADLRAGLPDWDPTGFGRAYTEPVRPPTIIDLAAIEGLPSVLAGLFAVAMVGAVVAGLEAGIRGRRTELAIIRDLGATRRQRRASIRVQAVTSVAIGTAVGLPAGVALAQIASGRMVEELGVVDDLSVTPLSIVAVGGGALLLALVVAEVLARREVGRHLTPTADPTRTG